MPPAITLGAEPDLVSMMSAPARTVGVMVRALLPGFESELPDAEIVAVELVVPGVVARALKVKVCALPAPPSRFGKLHVRVWLPTAPLTEQYAGKFPPAFTTSNRLETAIVTTALPTADALLFAAVTVNVASAVAAMGSGSAVYCETCKSAANAVPPSTNARKPTNIRNTAETSEVGIQIDPSTRRYRSAMQGSGALSVVNKE